MAPNDRGPDAAPERRCDRPDLALWLPVWDELEATRRRELVDHAAGCPECGPKLALLERAEAWLHRQDAPAAVGACPSANELYDYGRGPGSQRMSDAERLALRAHLASCAECSSFVTTLAQRPPSPMLYGDAAAAPAIPAPRRRRSAWLVLVPAAAAALLAIVLWRFQGRSSRPDSAIQAAVPHIRFPVEPALRGASAETLLYPRERVLRTEAELWAPLTFEIAPRERATQYRVTLRRTTGGAFDVGQELKRWQSAAPLIEDLDLDLDAGHYTWEAWAVVDGLDVPLGSRDFDVVADAAIGAELRARDSAPEPARSESILHLLHDAGFVGDARAFARELPPSPERDAYLARRPSR